MKIKDFKCKCGHNDFFFAAKGVQKGIYCSYCGKWIKWADKDEQNLAMKQEPILDKLRAEIEQLPTTKCTETHRIYIDADDFKENVLTILDKYKAETET